MVFRGKFVPRSTRTIFRQIVLYSFVANGFSAIFYFIYERLITIDYDRMQRMLYNRFVAAKQIELFEHFDLHKTSTNS